MVGTSSVAGPLLHEALALVRDFCCSGERFCAWRCESSVCAVSDFQDAKVKFNAVEGSETVRHFWGAWRFGKSSCLCAAVAPAIPSSWRGQLLWRLGQLLLTWRCSLQDCWGCDMARACTSSVSVFRYVELSFVFLIRWISKSAHPHIRTSSIVSSVECRVQLLDSRLHADSTFSNL